MSACIGEPISWLRLEQLALGTTDAAADSHLAACPACRQCLDEIRGDVVALPALPAIAAPRRRWWTWAVPALGVAAAAALLLVIVRPHAPATRDNVTSVKGVGEVVLGLVRERGGTIANDPATFAPGDRFKVVVTCPPSARAWIDVSVADPDGTDHPLAPAQLACGNRVVVPGAFTLTGTHANRICVTVSASRGAPASTACVTISPESPESEVRSPRPSERP